MVSEDCSCRISASAFWGEMYTVKNGLLRVITKWFLNEYVPIRIDFE